MARWKKTGEPPELNASGDEGVKDGEDNFIEGDAIDEEPVPEDEIICKLTQERRKVTPEEEIIQVLIDQLHREYRVEMANMARDLSFRISQYDESAVKSKILPVALPWWSIARKFLRRSGLRMTLCGR